MNLSTATEKKKDEAYEYMAERSRPGPILILSFFFLFIYISPIYYDQPVEIYIIAVLLLINSMIRMYNEFGFKHLYPENKARWRIIYNASISFTGLVWGIFCLIIVVEYGINWVSLLVLVCTAGLSAGGIIAVIPSRALSYTFQSLILLPTALFSFTLDTAAAYSISYMFLVYLVFMSLMSTKLHQEYWVSVKNVILLDKRAAELEVARDKAIKLAETKTAFLATMSHELRTPMNGILGMAQLLNLTKLNDEQQEYTSTIKSSTESLLTIINDILHHSKLEAGKLSVEYQHFQLKPLINNIYELLKPAIIEKGLKLDLEIADNIPDDLIGDQGKIRQILLNLLGNAIKFTNQGSIKISAKYIEDESQNSIHFIISDTGIGISPEKQKMIFTDFSQADNSTTREYGGTGLGLTISKQLVALMKGEIGVNSKKNIGSRFWFEIPIACAGASRNTKPNEQGQAHPELILDPLVQTQLKQTMEDDYPDLIKSHIDTSNEIMKQIHRCIDEKDNANLLPYLNSLKSSSASIGAKILEAEIEYIEKNILKNIQPDDAVYQKLQHIFNEVVTALNHEIH